MQRFNASSGRPFSCCWEWSSGLFISSGSSSSSSSVVKGEHGVITVVQTTSSSSHHQVVQTALSKTESFYTTEQSRVSCSNNVDFTYESLEQQQHGPSAVGRRHSDNQHQTAPGGHHDRKLTFHDNSSPPSDAPPVCEGWLQKQGGNTLRSLLLF